MNFTKENNAHRSSDKKEARMSVGRILTYAFLKLPFHAQLKIIEGLELSTEEERDLPTLELFKQAFSRAKEKQLLEELWTKVAEFSEDIKLESENPFIGR